jgi:adenosylcobinamide-GDP ribazoletransferase
MTFLVTAFAIGELAKLNNSTIIQSLIVVEVLAKLSMVIATWAGKAVRKGMNSPFMEAMHGKNGNARLIAALAISFVIVVPLMWLAGVVTLLAAIISSLVMVSIAHRHFNGVTGDVLGATNELTRMVSLIVLLAVIRWL